MEKCAIFLSGPIGVGKTTLGRALSLRLAAAFIDGDDHSDPLKPWYGSIYGASRSIVTTGLAALDETDTLIVATPLNWVNWIYFRRHFEAARVRPIAVSLRASYSAIVDPHRGRRFEPSELQRIQTMIVEGYDQRPFSDLVVDTDKAGFAETVALLETALRSIR